MILTDYYRFERVATIAKHRMDCTASTGSYPLFEQLRKTKAMCKSSNRDGFAVGDLLIYWGKPDGHMRSDRKRQANRSITIGSKNLSSVYDFMQEAGCYIAYGDARGTADALLIRYHVEEVDATIQAGSFIEVFVARGKANQCNGLCNLYEDGELDEETEALRQAAQLPKQ